MLIINLQGNENESHKDGYQKELQDIANAGTGVGQRERFYILSGIGIGAVTTGTIMEVSKEIKNRITI
jgi:hypothetical protein